VISFNALLSEIGGWTVFSLLVRGKEFIEDSILCETIHKKIKNLEDEEQRKIIVRQVANLLCIPFPDVHRWSRAAQEKVKNQGYLLEKIMQNPIVRPNWRRNFIQLNCYNNPTNSSDWSGQIEECI
jgi:hypothetical protein